MAVACERINELDQWVKWEQIWFELSGGSKNRGFQKLDSNDQGINLFGRFM